MDARQYLALVRRRRAVIASSTLLLTVVALVFAQLRPLSYRAQATVAVVQSDPVTDFFEGAGAQEDSPVEEEAAFVASAAVASEAVELLGGGDAGTLLGTLSVEANPSSDTITIAATDPSPERAQEVANAFAEAFVVTRTAARQAANESRIARFDQKLDELRAEIDALDAQLGAESSPDAQGEVAGDGVGAASEDGLGAEPGTPAATREALALQYQLVFERQQDLRIQQDLQPSGVVVASTATLPSEPIGPGTASIGAVAVLAGLMVGFALAVLRDFLDDRIQTTEQLVEIVDAPILAELPVAKGARGESAGGPATSAPSAVAEAARILRTNLESVATVEGIRSLVVASATSGDGRTFVTAHLAAVYAQAGYDVVAVSSDLRNPSLETLLEVPVLEGAGLSLLLHEMGARPQRRDQRPERYTGVVTSSPTENGSSSPFRLPANGRPVGERRCAEDDDGRASAADRALRAAIIRQHVVRQPDLALSVVPAGPVPPNPAELLSAHFAEVLQRLAADADLVLLDSPPVPPVTDASILASHADAVLLVVTLGNTKRADLRRTRDTLANLGARVVGVVVNRAKATTYARGGPQVQPTAPGSARTTPPVPVEVR